MSAAGGGCGTTRCGSSAGAARLLGRSAAPATAALSAVRFTQAASCWFVVSVYMRGKFLVRAGTPPDGTRVTALHTGHSTEPLQVMLVRHWVHVECPHERLRGARSLLLKSSMHTAQPSPLARFAASDAASSCSRIASCSSANFSSCYSSCIVNLAPHVRLTPRLCSSC
jgi:hypothetical protein